MVIPMKYSVGVDFGGTKVSVALVDDKGHIVEKSILPSGMEKRCRAMVAQVSDEIKCILKRYGLQLGELYSIGVGIPGTADREKKIALLCPNLAWDNEPIGEFFIDELGVDIHLIQDTRAAAIAELVYGVGRRFTDFICVVVGTGISCGIVIDSKIYHGAFNTSGELGDIVIEKDGRLCNCGNRGCLEQYVSGVGIISIAMERFPKDLQGMPETAKSVFDLAESGHEGAILLLMEANEKLALCLAAAINLLSPQAVVISGGICENEEFFMKPLKHSINKFAYKLWVLQNPNGVFKSDLTSEAPLIGAASQHKLQ